MLWAALDPPEGWTLYRTWTLGGDYTQYRSAMLQGYEGEWLIVNRFTPEPHRRVLQYPLYVLLGHLARWLHLPLEALYFATVSLSIAVLVGSLCGFAKAFLAHVSEQRLAFLLTLSSGPGWLILFLQALFPGISWLTRYKWAFDRPEVNTFLLFSSAPHLPLSLALLLWLVAAYWRQGDAESRISPSRLILCAVTVVAIGLLNPFCLAPLFALLGLAWIWRFVESRRCSWPYTLSLGLLGLVALPLLVYNFWIFTFDPFWGRTYGTQNYQASYPVDVRLLGYGVTAFLAALGIAAVWRHKPEGRYLTLSAVVLFLMGYLPTTYQRRFSFGLAPLLAVLAVPGWQWLASREWMRRLRSVSGGRIIGSVLLFLLLWGQNLSYAVLYGASYLGTGPTDRYVFQPRTLKTIATYLYDYGESAVVLTCEETGNMLAGEIRGRVVLGHAGATIDVDRRREEVQAFFGGALTPAECTDLLLRYGVTHVVVSPLDPHCDRLLPDPEWETIISEGDYQLFSVVRSVASMSAVW